MSVAFLVFKLSDRQANGNALFVGKETSRRQETTMVVIARTPRKDVHSRLRVNRIQRWWLVRCIIGSVIGNVWMELHHQTGSLSWSAHTVYNVPNL